MNINKNDLIYLEKSYSPKLILWFYWLSLILTAIGAILSMFETGFTFLSFVQGIFIFIFGFLFLRFLMELCLIPFKIEKHLDAIKQKALAQNETMQTKESELGNL